MSSLLRRLALGAVLPLLSCGTTGASVCDPACGGGYSCVGGECVSSCDSPGPSDDRGECVTCVPLSDVSLFPLTLTRGDREFDGHGPDVKLTVTLSRSPASVTATTCVTMTETEADWTTGTRCQTQTVQVNNVAIVSDTYFEVDYLDTDHGWDDAKASSYFLDDSDVVLGVSCVGDTLGRDVCSDDAPPDCSTCKVDLGCVKVKRAP